MIVAIDAIQARIKLKSINPQDARTPIKESESLFIKSSIRHM